MARKVLVVDDNAINRQMLINTLESDYDILEAENGKEALSLIHRNFKVLSAVLLDILMPEVDGFEVLRQVRENAMLSQIPIIMVTGSDDENARVKALSLGANDFIIKPFNPEIVMHCLRNNIALRETASILNAIQRDKLTGLYNREAFFDKAGDLIQSREPGYYILSCFDIDNFKLINDQYGADEGDRILKKIGNLLRPRIDGMGGLAGRISADNFVLLFPASQKKNDLLGHRLNDSILTEEGYVLYYSVGRYIITDISLPVSAIYDRAYLAKQSVKGRYDVHLAYFDQAMLERLVRNQQIANEMVKALADHQFEIWFQPQYNYLTSECIGAEALVRWRHPDRGMVSPGEFIPLFERNGFVYEMDKFVWKEACSYLRRWIDAGLDPMPISVNVSRYDMFRNDLIETITGIVNSYNVPAELLHLEITETAFASSTKQIVEIVKLLISLGFTIEIDDFGSGYSSLNTLKSVPAQVMKLDMRFLEEGDDEQRGGNILSSIVRMTKWLGMTVIAEGVESKEQGDFLKSIGCNYVQGYFYARPMPAADYERLMISGSRQKNEMPVLETTENLSNDRFWDPSSIDSLIFNSFVGSACIYEFDGHSLELLRATEKFAQMFDGNISVDELMHLHIMAYVDKKSYAEVLKQVEVSVQNMDETIAEFLFLDLPGCLDEVYVRSTMRVIASTGDRYLIYSLNENITTQRRAEQKEQLLTKQIKAILDNVNCGITAMEIADQNGRFLLANDQLFSLLGYSRDEFRNLTLAERSTLICPEDRLFVGKMVKKTTETGQPVSFEYRVRRRDGTIIWLRSNLSITDFEGVERNILLCTYVDITSERQMAQDVLDNLPCGAGLCVLTADDDLQISYLNQHFYSYFPDEVDFRNNPSLFEAVHPDDRVILRESMRAVFEKSGEGNCVIRLRNGDEYVTFRISGISRKTDKEECSIYVTFVPIVHETISVYEMLPVILEKMMASSTDLSFVKDQQLRYICCSKAFAHMVGLADEKEVFGKTDYDLFDQEYADRYAADDRALMEDNQSIVDKIEIIPSTDGKNHFSSTSKYLLYNTDGNLVGLYGTGHDVTRKIEMESQQRFLINNIPGGVAIYEVQWSTLKSIKLVYYSDGFCQLFGFDRDEYAKHGYLDSTGMVLDEYKPGLIKQIEDLVKNGTAIDYIFRAHHKENKTLWIHIKALLDRKAGKKTSVNALLLDVTEYQEALARLRVSEEENRLAIEHSKNVVCRFDVATRSLAISSKVNSIFGVANVIEGVPYSQITNGSVSPETADDYVGFYEDIINGAQNPKVIYQRTSQMGWRWIKAKASTIFSTEGVPVSAVISVYDITESYEKDIAYKKWKQSLQKKAPQDYALIRCNITRKELLGTVEGSLLQQILHDGIVNLPELTETYATQAIYPADQEHYVAFMNVEGLLTKFEHGDRSLVLEYREMTSVDAFRWLKLSVDLVQYSHSTDIEAYLLFENIDEEKRTELRRIERAEKDALTGLLNRVTFSDNVDLVIRDSVPNAEHALLMLDLDGFKMVNDDFGHAAGDDTLKRVADLLLTVSRRDDLVGRLGGDEFVLFLNNIPEAKVAAKRAKEICDLTREVFCKDFQISSSIGIALYPADGMNFAELYQSADRAMYHVKNIGRDNFAFYNEDMKGSISDEARSAQSAKNHGMTRKKRRMLIVEDNKFDFELLSMIFKKEYIVERAKDGASALIRMRHYGSAISVVLLDLMMPGMDGFAVLEKKQQSPDMRSIPVVVVSADDSRQTSLRAIRAGASDFVTKPVDADLLRIRVQSAISKIENERLRVKNSVLELQSDEALRYQTVLGRMGYAIVEIDWGKSLFSYSPSIPKQLAGVYDDRSLWHILMSDMVTETQTVREIQDFVLKLANDRERTEDSMTAKLKTPTGKSHLFAITVYKIVNEYGLASKMIMAFKDQDANS